MFFVKDYSFFLFDFFFFFWSRGADLLSDYLKSSIERGNDKKIGV